MTSIAADGWAHDFSDWGQLRANGSVSANYPYDNTTVPDYWALRARQAYWASISFTDDNFGVLVKAARTAGLYESLITIFVGDHGFQLGDNDLWSKVTNFEHATRVPLLVRAPGVSSGGVVSTFVESISLFPTVAELAAGVSVPPCPSGLHASRATVLCTHGVSMVPLLHGGGPGGGGSAVAYSQVPRGNSTRGMPGGKCASTPGQVSSPSNKYRDHRVCKHVEMTGFTLRFLNFPELGPDIDLSNGVGMRVIHGVFCAHPRLAVH